MLVLTLGRPYGVVAAVIPWNASVAFFGSKTAPMIAAGNCVVLKSSEKAPLTASIPDKWLISFYIPKLTSEKSASISTLIQKVDFLPGVINAIHGHHHISGATLSSHMDVRVRSFTGSGGTGRLITEAAVKSNLKNVYLEKSLATMYDDADLDAAAKETQHSIAWNSGHVCMANSRIYVQNTVAEKFITMFKDNCANVKIGVFTDPGVQMCPLADESQFQSVNKYIELGKSAGGMLIHGNLDTGTIKSGYFVGLHISHFPGTPNL